MSVKVKVVNEHTRITLTLILSYSYLFKMIKSKGLFVLLSIYSVLLATYGHKIGITLVVSAASATTSIKNVKATSTTTTKSSSCDVNSNEPDCIADNNNSNDNNDNQKKNNVQQQRSTKDVPRKDKQSNSHSQQHNNNNPRPKFKTGDIIELYNTDSRDIQIVFPSIVKGRDTNTGTYRVTKTTDGKEVTNLPEKYLHLYIPYDIGSLALCNVGSFSNKANENRPIIVQCTVENYMPAAKRGAMVLQGKYSVLVHETNVNGNVKEEYRTTLPVWKLQRRYLGEKNGGGGGGSSISTEMGDEKNSKVTTGDEL